jgi:hypothetical protein
MLKLLEKAAKVMGTTPTLRLLKRTTAIKLMRHQARRWRWAKRLLMHLIKI